MRSILPILCLSLIATSVASAQVIDSVIDQKLYAGALWTGVVIPPSTDLANNVNVRVSGQIITGNDQFRTTGRFVWTPKIGLGQIWSTYENDAEYRLGFMPRPITAFMRAAPFLPDAHFEPSAKAVIPGPAWGLGRFQLNGSEKSGYGVYYNANHQWEAHVAFARDLLGESVLAFYYESSDSGGLGAAFKQQFKISESVPNLEFDLFAGDTTMSIFCSAEIVPIGNPYVSWVNSINVPGSWNADRSLEAGVTRNFRGGLVSGLFGLGYNWIEKAIKFYLFVHSE